MTRRSAVWRIRACCPRMASTSSFPGTPSKLAFRSLERRTCGESRATRRAVPPASEAWRSWSSTASGRITAGWSHPSSALRKPSPKRGFAPATTVPARPGGTTRTTRPAPKAAALASRLARCSASTRSPAGARTPWWCRTACAPSHRLQTGSTATCLTVQFAGRWASGPSAPTPAGTGSRIARWSASRSWRRSTRSSGQSRCVRARSRRTRSRAMWSPVRRRIPSPSSRSITLHTSSTIPRRPRSHSRWAVPEWCSSAPRWRSSVRWRGTIAPKSSGARTTSRCSARESSRYPKRAPFAFSTSRSAMPESTPVTQDSARRR